ncbi:MAG: biotin transporter BioY [Gemmatimonadaceae bacterium]
MTAMTKTSTAARERVPAWVAVTGFAAAMAVASQVAIPLPFTPVPITLQPMVVVLAGLWLGPRLAVTSMLVYIAAGIVGLPVWSPIGLPGAARLVGPTGGYILAYPVAALTAGVLGARATTLTGRWLAASAGMVVLLLGGTAQLAILTGSLSKALTFGLHPFVALDFVKAFVAAALASSRRGDPTAW